jgi:hypothetical protein
VSDICRLWLHIQSLIFVVKEPDSLELEAKLLSQGN